MLGFFVSAFDNNWPAIWRHWPFPRNRHSTTGLRFKSPDRLRVSRKKSCFAQQQAGAVRRSEVTRRKHNTLAGRAQDLALYRLARGPLTQFKGEQQPIRVFAASTELLTYLSSRAAQRYRNGSDVFSQFNGLC